MVYKASKKEGFSAYLVDKDVFDFRVFSSLLLNILFILRQIPDMKPPPWLIVLL